MAPTALFIKGAQPICWATGRWDLAEVGYVILGLPVKKIMIMVPFYLSHLFWITVPWASASTTHSSPDVLPQQDQSKGATGKWTEACESTSQMLPLTNSDPYEIIPAIGNQYGQR